MFLRVINRIDVIQQTQIQRELCSFVSSELKNTYTRFMSFF